MLWSVFLCGAMVSILLAFFFAPRSFCCMRRLRSHPLTGMLELGAGIGWSQEGSTLPLTGLPQANRCE